MRGSKKISKDRRMSQRLNLPVKVKYRLLKKRKVLEEIFTQNVSGGGVGLRLNRPLRKGTRIKTLLRFPTDPKPIAAFSVVVWCKKSSVQEKTYYDIGIKHLKIIPSDRERFVFLFCEMMINFFVGGRNYVSKI